MTKRGNLRPETPRENEQEPAEAVNIQESGELSERPKVAQPGTPRARVGVDLAALGEETDPLAVRRVLLSNLDFVINESLSRRRETRDGRDYLDADFSAAIRGLELAGRWLGVDRADPQVLIQMHGEAVKLYESARRVLADAKSAKKLGPNRAKNG